MIINESNSRNDYEEIEIKDPRKFISAIGGLMDNGLKEAIDDDPEIKANAEELDQIFKIAKMNRMSVPPTIQQITKNDNKIKVPWFLVGTLLSKAKNYGLEKKFKERNK